MAILGANVKLYDSDDAAVTYGQEGLREYARKAMLASGLNRCVNNLNLIFS